MVGGERVEGEGEQRTRDRWQGRTSPPSVDTATASVVSSRVDSSGEGEAEKEG